jgi:DnaJ-class molecular chaperone
MFSARDCVQQIEVPLEQFYSGATRKLAINRQVVDKAAGVKSCEACNGKGISVRIIRMGPMIQQMQSQCEECNGLGMNICVKALHDFGNCA